MQYSSFIQDLPNDSDEDKYIEKEDRRNEDVAVELPAQEPSLHFKKFEIRFRNKESKEDTKTTLITLEKE